MRLGDSSTMRRGAAAAAHRSIMKVSDKALWLGIGLGVATVALSALGLYGPWSIASTAQIFAEDVKVSRS